MENLLFFTACLSLFLGVLQLFFPNILKQIEEFTDQILVGESCRHLHLEK